MLNSWGTTEARPDGLFMVSMDMNYSCNYTGLGYAYDWMILDAQFERAATPEVAEEGGGGLRSASQVRAEAERKVEEAKEELEAARMGIPRKCRLGKIDRHKSDL